MMEQQESLHSSKGSQMLMAKGQVDAMGSLLSVASMGSLRGVP
jgi:hypothetical protein